MFKTIRKFFRFPPIEMVLAFFTEDKESTNFFVKLAPGNNLYSINTMRYVKRKGINYMLDISDYQNWLIYFGVNVDRPEGLFELVKQDSVIIDVGTNIGQTAMTFAKLAGENSSVIGFEPDPLNYSMAIANLNLNKFRNLKIYNIGLGPQKGTLPLKINTPSNRGGNRIDKINSANSVNVAIELLDNFLDERMIAKVDLIKIDVEGFELEVLKGAEKTLKRSRPVLFIEISDTNLREQGTNPKELLNYLKELGYKSIHSKTKKLIEELHDFTKCQFDIIAVFPA